MENELFLDTAFAIALASTTDQHHAKALILADDLEKTRARLVTTWAVMLEIGNALAKRRFRQAAVDLLSSLQKDPTVTIVPFTEDLYAQGFLLFQERMDKEWGLIDCISFVVMKSRGLTKALAADIHYKQAGFTRCCVNDQPFNHRICTSRVKLDLLPFPSKSPQIK